MPDPHYHVCFSFARFALAGAVTEQQDDLCCPFSSIAKSELASYCQELRSHSQRLPAKIAMQVAGYKTRSIFERYNTTEEGEDLTNAVARLAEYRNKQKETASKEPEKVVAGNFGG
jgi:hypothetical protein